jgi:enamine deaminase RidA (YjgF/YER057c/UK114 family)
MPEPSYAKEILLEDERGRGCAAVVRCGPYLFVGGSDGHRNLQSEQIDPELAGRAIEQCRNSYGRIDRRLRACGYAGNQAVWIENFTSGQEWRLPRMALWPEYFGETEHGLAVSFGAQTRMSGINMITTSVLALTPDVERTAVVPQPEPGRAARCTRAGDFIYIIGVRGHEHPETHAVAPEEREGAFEIQLQNCFAWLGTHAANAGASLQDLVRADACIRDVNRIDDYRTVAKSCLGDAIPFTGYVTGVPLGARLEQEVGAIAVAPGAGREVAWYAGRSNEAQAVRAGGLVFVSACSGLREANTGAILRDLYGDKSGQARQAFRRLEAALRRFDVGLHRLLRLDVWLRDIYFEDGCIAIAREVLGPETPAITVLGGDLSDSAEVEISAIAAA